MKKNLLSLIMLCCMVIAKAQTQPNNEIWYTSSDGKVVTPNNANFNVSIESNEYKDGKGVIIFSGELTNIGVSAFSGKTTLTSVTIPASVTSIGEWAFSGCKGLASLTFAEGSQLETIGYGAFNDVAISGELTLPALVTIIGDNAFSGTKITAVTIPASVTSIGSYAFSGCKSLATLTFAEGSQLGTIGNDAFKSTVISGELTLPALVTIIGDNAFSETKITAVTIPASTKVIGWRAFYNCSELQTLTIAEGSQLETIGASAFSYANISGELTIPASLKSMGDYTFAGCKLTKVYMSSEDLTDISEIAFNGGAIIVVPITLYEEYNSHFIHWNKVETTSLKDWQEYTIARIEAAQQTVNTLSDTDQNTIATYISTIKNATTFDGTLDAYFAALDLIDQQKAFEESVRSVLEDLGTRQNGPAVRITDKDGRSFILYSPKSVEYIKVKEE